MRSKLSLILFSLLLALTTSASAQEASSAAETAERLRAQLLEVQSKQDALRAQAEQLEEDLKPENIERALAGIGSTKPEELRESRRRQLTIERDGVLAQLKILETSRSRLETAIANADALAYQQSARRAATNKMLMSQYYSSPRLLILVGLVALVLVFAAAIVLRRRL
jgi:hypothetical protein